MLNFNSTIAIISSLGWAPIHRLINTWAFVPKEQMATYAQLQQLFSVSLNYSAYREALRTASPPCVPFLGCYLKDFIFIEQGNPTKLEQYPNFVNFSKFNKMAEIIREIQKYQQFVYSFTPVPEIQLFLTRGFEDSISEDKLYDLSLALEPRGAVE
jgi:son of sevenless-like protein